MLQFRLFLRSINTAFILKSQNTLMTNIDLKPFSVWTPRAVADPRRASQAQFMDGIREILASQGPMQGLHLFQTYAKAGGLMKIAAPVRSRFQRAVQTAEKAGELLVDRENDSEVDGPDDPRGWIIRLPDQDRVQLRALGPRSFAEIPLSELAAHVLEIRCQDEFLGREDIARLVLDHYGLQKLTSLVQRRISRVFEDFF